jgi:hypothetical protein
MNKKRENNTPPPGWCSDNLTDFVERAYQNSFATFHNKKKEYLLLSTLDECFMEVQKDWSFKSVKICPLLFLRSHSAFRASCEHALSGHLSAIFPQIRVCIEYAGYALHINENDGFEKIWLNRHQNVGSRALVRKKFVNQSIQKTIKESNGEAQKEYDSLYNLAIDFGAHPNELSVTSNLSIEDNLHHKLVEQVYLHNNGPKLDFGLNTVARTGLCSLEIFQDVFPDRYKDLGVQQKVSNFRNNLMLKK